MRRLALSALLLIATLFQPAEARFPRGSGGTSLFNGSALMNAGDAYFSTMTNVFKSCSTQAAAANPADIFLLNANGYLASQPANILLLCNPAQGTYWPNTTYKLFGTGTNKTPFLFLGSNISGCSATGVTVSGCSGSGNTTFRPTSNGWSVTFTVGSGGFGSIYFNNDALATYGGTGEVVMARNANTPVSDETLYLAGKYWTSEYENGTTRTGALCGISPGIMRFMPLTLTASTYQAQNFNNQTNFANRNLVTDFSWKVGKVPAGNVVGGGGTITVTNGATSALTASATPNTPISLTDGEVAIGIPSAANTTTTVTLDVGGRGAKPVSYASGALIPTGGQPLTTDTVWTFVYSGVRQTWIASPGGINWSYPIEATAQLANDCGADAWYNLPPMATAAYTTSWADTIRDSVTKNVYFEYSNEVWNSAFGVYGYAYNSGISLGWIVSSGENVDSWYALRSKLMSDILVTEFAGQTSRLRPTQEYIGCCLDVGVGSSDNRLGGAMLVPNKVTTATVTFTGGTPCVVNWSNNGFQNGWPTSYTSTGTLPTNITSAQVYYVSANQNSNNGPFNLASTPGGAAIPCTGNGTGTITGNYTNPFYSAAGYGNYSVKPNRPIDQTYSIGGAAYAVGENLCSGPDVGCTLTATNGPFFQCLTNAMEGGSTAGCPASTAIGLVDWDVRQGRSGIQTITCSGTTITTPAAITFALGAFDKGVSFQVAGGTGCPGITPNKLYSVSSTSTTSCPGGVTCNFTIQNYVGGTPSGANVTVGSTGTGTMTVGGNRYQTIVLLSSIWYSLNQAIANKYAADRPVSGPFTATLKGIQYEGELELLAGSYFGGGSYSPNPSACTTMSVTSPAPITTSFTGTTAIGGGNNPAAITSVSSFTNVWPGMVLSAVSGDLPAGTYVYAIDTDAKTITLSANATGAHSTQAFGGTGNCISDGNAAIDAWKNDNASYLTQLAFFNSYVGKDASFPATSGVQGLMKAPASLSLLCAGPYSLINGCLPNSPVFQTYNGYRDWSRTNWLLKRDMQEPGSANDNDPMWLEKAA